MSLLGVHYLHSPANIRGRSGILLGELLLTPINELGKSNIKPVGIH